MPRRNTAPQKRAKQSNARLLLPTNFTAEVIRWGKPKIAKLWLLTIECVKRVRAKLG